jgi:hypothetical protein
VIEFELPMLHAVWASLDRTFCRMNRPCRGRKIASQEESCFGAVPMRQHGPLAAHAGPRPNRPQRHGCSRPAHSSPPMPGTAPQPVPHVAGCKDGLCLELQCRQDACTFRASRPLRTLSFSPSCWISALSGRFTAIMTCHRVSNSGVICSVLGKDGYRAPVPALRTLSSRPVCASSSTCLTGYICHAPDNEIPRGGSGSYIASCTDSTDQSAARNKALQ